MLFCLSKQQDIRLCRVYMYAKQQLVKLFVTSPTIISTVLLLKTTLFNIKTAIPRHINFVSGYLFLELCLYLFAHHFQIFFCYVFYIP